MSDTKFVEPKGVNFILLALWAFSALGIEALYAFLLEPMVYGKQIADWNVGQNICHWTITCITWGIATYVILRIAKQKYGFDIFAPGSKVKAWQWLALLCCVIFSFSTSYLDWGGFKVVKEFQALGLLKFIFQYIYYAFETALFTLILVFGQKAFELWFKPGNIPYSGIVLALTWGLAHIFTKDIQTGLWSAVLGFVFGVVYLLVNKDIRKALPILFIMFVF